MPNALIAPGGVVDDRRRRPLTPQDYDLIQAYRGRPVSLDVLGPPPTTMETVGALAPLAGAAVMAPSLPAAMATIPLYHFLTSGKAQDLPSIPTLPGEPWATLSDFVLGMGGGGPGAYNRAAVIRRPSPGWKSTLKGLVEQKLPAKATPEQLEAIARYAPKEEVQYVNLSDLAGGPLRKEDVLQTIEQRNVPLEETLRTEGDVKYGSFRTPGGEDYRELLLTLPNEARKRIAELQEEQDAIPITNWDRTPEQVDRYYALEREMRALMDKAPPAYQSSHWPGEPNVLAHTRLNTFLDPQGKKVLLVDEIQSDWHQAGRERGYVGSAPDLATLKQKRDDVRAQIEAMRPDADAGRIPRADFLRVIDDFQQADHAYRRAASGPDPGAVPDAPFKREWHELAFKRALREAAETGAEKLAWTTGTQQAQRYDLSKHVGKVVYHPESQELFAFDPSGRRVITEAGVEPQDLDQYIGPELGARLREKSEGYRYREPDKFSVERDPDDTGWVVYDQNGEIVSDVFTSRMAALNERNHLFDQYGQEQEPPSLSGLDLKVGGEGMKGFYDQILPSFANKYLKQFGLKTGETKLPTTNPYQERWSIVDRNTGEVAGYQRIEADAQQVAREWSQRYGAEYEVRPTKRETQTFHSIDITPELREFLMRGQPLFGSKK